MITGEMFHIVKMSQWIPPLVQFQKSTNFQKYHYLPVAETPITNTDDGKRREVDDSHPRARLKQVHKKMKSISRIVQVFRPLQKIHC